MSQEKKNETELVNDIDSLLVQTGAICHEIPLGEGQHMNVWVKELSFLQTQKAIKEVVNISGSGGVSVDLAGYWTYMMRQCIDRTEPSLSKAQILALKPSVAQLITALLPQPQDLMTGPLVDGEAE